MATINGPEETLNRYLHYSTARSLASIMRSDKPGANQQRILMHLARVSSRSALDLYISFALQLYHEGAHKGEPLNVILSKIEEHRNQVLGVLEYSRRLGRQPLIDSYVYCTDLESKIRMLLKNICVQQLRVFLLSYRKSFRKLTPCSSYSEGIPFYKKKSDWIYPAA